MAVRTYRLNAGNDANKYALLSETDQTAANRTAGDSWTVGKSAAGLANEWVTDGIATAIGFATASGVPGATVGWSASSFRSSAITGPLTSAFANTAWTFTFAVRATTVSAQAGRVRLRVWKSTFPNPLAADVTELTAATQVGTTTGTLSTTADVTSVVTWSPGTTITLTNEYLFFQLGWEITTASGNNSSNVILRTGQSAGGTRIVTPDDAVVAAAKPRRLRVTPNQAVIRAAVR